MRRDLWLSVECERYDYLSWCVSSASGGAVEAVQVAGERFVVGAGGLVSRGPCAAVSSSGPFALFAAAVPGGDLVRVVHRHAMGGDPVPGARFAEWRDVSATAGGVGAARGVRTGAGRVTRRTRARETTRLVAGDRGRVAGGREKGG